MTDVIGRADYLLGADVSGVKTSVAEAEREILKSGQRVESDGNTRAYRVGQVIGLGIKGVATASTALFAIAAKGASDLGNATADYRAETGATAADADKAGKAINAMSGRNIQGIKEIGSALTKVHSDMGLTGDEAEKTTERFLKFARATKQDATGAVVAFDDILDAWGLTAKDATGIMDKLVLSHQKYGGSIIENQAALARMAPQLKALNLTVDDGIGLLNLFASSGLNAADGQKALNAAITKLPPGESMDQFIARLSTIEDDGARAQEAMKVFGARAGAGLANAIRPGVDSLDAFKVSATDAVGATQRAADAMDSTFGAQVQLKIKAVTAAIVDLGPGITGVASALSLVGSFAGVLHLDDVLKKFGPGLVAAGLSAGQRAGEAMSDGLQAVFSGAEGTIIGNNISNRIENIFGSGETVVGKAWRKVTGSRAAQAATFAAGTASGAIYGAAAAGGEKLSGFVAAAWAAVPASGVVRSAVLTAGLASGGVYGGAFGTAARLALGAGAVLAVAEIAATIKPELDKVGGQIHDTIFGKGGGALGTGIDVKGFINDLPWPLGPKGEPDWLNLAGANRAGLDTAVIQPLAEATVLAGDKTGNIVRDVADHSADVAVKLGAALGKAAAVAGAALDSISKHAHNAGSDYAMAALKIQQASGRTADKLVDDASRAIDNAFDPQIQYYQLVAANAELSAARKAAAAKGAGAAEREAVIQAEKAQAELLLASARAGDTNSKAYKTALADLQTEIRNATGPTRVFLRNVYDDIVAVDKLDPTVTIRVVAQMSPAAAKALDVMAARVTGHAVGTGPLARAEGGPVSPGELYHVNEGGRIESYFTPGHPGYILDAAKTAALVKSAAATGLSHDVIRGAAATMAPTALGSFAPAPHVGDVHVHIAAGAFSFPNIDKVDQLMAHELDRLGDRLGQRVRAAIIGPGR